MLVKDENKFCYIVNNKISEPKDSLKEAIQDYLEEAKENGYSLDSIELSNPYFFVPELSGRRIVDNLIYDFPNIMFNAYDKCITRRYIPHMEPKHIEELSKELSKIYYDWEKRHGYDNKSYIVFTEDIKIYPIR
jgi:uncharacterized protein (UPF0335 family)